MLPFKLVDVAHRRETWYSASVADSGYIDWPKAGSPIKAWQIWHDPDCSIGTSERPLCTLPAKYTPCWKDYIPTRQSCRAHPRPRVSAVAMAHEAYGLTSTAINRPVNFSLLNQGVADPERSTILNLRRRIGFAVRRHTANVDRGEVQPSQGPRALHVPQ